MLGNVRWRGLRTRIVAWSFVPTTIILLAVALVAFYSYQSVTEDLVMGRNRELVRLSASQIASNQSEYADPLASLARTGAMYKGYPYFQQEALVQARNRLVVFDGGVVTMDSHGKIAAADPDRPGLVGQDWSDRLYFRQVLRTLRPASSDILPDGPNGALVVSVAVPITGEQGEFIGALVGMFRIGVSSVSSLYGGIVKLRTSDRGDTYLIDSQGMIVFHSDVARIGTNISNQPIVQQLLAGRMGTMRTRDIEGRDVVANYAPVPGSPWGLLVEENWSDLMGPSQGYRQFMMLLLALGVVVPVIVVTVGVRRITKPIEALILGARAVAGGQFDKRVMVRTGDELAELADHFNVMSSQLEASYSDLEKRVADRTKELSTLNAIAAVVSRSLDLKEILTDALSMTMEVVGMDTGSAFILNESGERLVLAADIGSSEAVLQYLTHPPADAGFRRLGAARGSPVWTRFAETPDTLMKELLLGDGLQVGVSIPMTARGKSVGSLNLATRTARTVTPEDLSLLASIGNQVAVAIENAKLYENVEKTAAEAERNRLARDLHDAVTQTLFSASLIASVLPKIWDRDPEEGRRRVEELRQLTRGALAEMRTLLMELRPAVLTETPLSDLLRQLSEAMTGRARIQVSLAVEGERALPPDVQISFYRVAQEALNNVVKHSGAKSAALKLSHEITLTRLCVSDDGNGFDAATVSPDHLGLDIMRERADAVGAAVSVTSEPGKGTVVEIVWCERRGTEEL